MIQPGASVGYEFPPQAYSPRTGFVYYGARYAPTIFQSFPNNAVNFGSAITPSVPGVTDYGFFGATNTETGRIAWEMKIPQTAKAGASVAGGIVFFGEDNGTFLGLNALTGQVLSSFDGPAMVRNAGGAKGAPSIYVVNGREYVAMAFGGNQLDRAFGQDPPLGDALLVFALPQS